MTKTNGLNQRLFVGGYDLSGDVGSISNWSTPRSYVDLTGIDKSAMERGLTLKDGQLEYMSFFNTAAGQAHPVLSALPTTDVQIDWILGPTLGNPSAHLIAKQVNYDPTRDTEAAFTFTISNLGNAYGGEWGIQLTAGQQTDSGATDGTGVDFSASTNYGLQAYLQVFSLTGTNVIVTIEESSDDGVGDSYEAVTGGAFTSVTSAPSTERIATANDLTVERYLRVATSGTFSEAIFSVGVVRNTEAVEF